MPLLLPIVFDDSCLKKSTKTVLATDLSLKNALRHLELELDTYSFYTSDRRLIPTKMTCLQLLMTVCGSKLPTLDSVPMALPYDQGNAESFSSPHTDFDRVFPDLSCNPCARRPVTAAD